jgi:hypothetical protein
MEPDQTKHTKQPPDGDLTYSYQPGVQRIVAMRLGVRAWVHLPGCIGIISVKPVSIKRRIG